MTFQNTHHITAQYLANIFFAVPPLQQAAGEKRKVCPFQRSGHRGSYCKFRRRLAPEILVFTAFGRHNGTLRSNSAVVMTVTANSNVVSPEVLHGIIYMIQKRVDVAGSLQKERITANADQAVLFYDCPADFIIFLMSAAMRSLSSARE